MELLGFRLIREKEHISMERINPDGTKTPLTMPNYLKKKLQHFVQFAHKQEFHGMIFLMLMKRPDGGLQITTEEKTYIQTFQASFAPRTKSS